MSNFLQYDLHHSLDLDSCRNDGRICLYIRENIFSRLLAEYKISDNTACQHEKLFIKVNMRKMIWLLNCSYNPNKKIFLNICAVWAWIQTKTSVIMITLCFQEISMLKCRIHVSKVFVTPTIYVAWLKNEHGSKTLLIHHTYIVFLQNMQEAFKAPFP